MSGVVHPITSVHYSPNILHRTTAQCLSYPVSHSSHRQRPNPSVRCDNWLAHALEIIIVTVSSPPCFHVIKLVGTAVLIRIDCTRSLAEILLKMFLLEYLSDRSRKVNLGFVPDRWRSSCWRPQKQTQLAKRTSPRRGSNWQMRWLSTATLLLQKISDKTLCTNAHQESRNMRIWGGTREATTRTRTQRTSARWSSALWSTAHRDSRLRWL